MRNR
jgi:hypothetical protein